ncbi:hypothetical protein MRB53_037563 [Persea americana]|nr:hypothetical protein MRB53_037563 [Persea americana]
MAEISSPRRSAFDSTTKKLALKYPTLIVLSLANIGPQPQDASLVSADELSHLSHSADLNQVLFATGDTLAQQAVEKKGFDKHDIARTGRMALYGGATLWFGFLQRRIRIPSSPNLEILARVGLDQTLFASTNLFCFLSSMALMEGTDPKKKLESTYWNALAKNWMVWPWVQMANFKVVPLDQRVLVVNVVSLGWNCYLSYLNTQGSGEGAKEKEKDMDDLMLEAS